MDNILYNINEVLPAFLIGGIAMEKAGLYVRLSDEDEGKVRKDDLSKSIINQKKLLENYAREKGFSVYKIYCDDDYSGLYDDRPGFEALLRDAREGNINVIIAKSQSRFTRNMEHVEHYLHQDFVEMGIRFIGVVDGVDTSIESNKKARQIYGLTNEWYCEDLSKNIRAVFQTKINEGQFIGSFAPYGYAKDPKDKNHLVVDPEAAQVVKRIFKLFINGHNVESICDTLSKDQIPTPAIYKKKQGLTYRLSQKYNYCEEYGLWAPTTVRRILENQTYIGHTVQGKSKKATYKSKKIQAINKSDWIIVKNTHEPLISKTDFDLIQKCLKARVRRDKQQLVISPLSGKLKCAECGNTIVTSGRNKLKTRTYMRCQLSKRSKSSFCTPHIVVVQEIEDIILQRIQNLVKEVIEKEDNIQELSEILQLNDLDASYKEEILKKLKILNSKIEEAKRMIKSLYMDKVKGIISEEMYLEMSADFERDIERYSKELRSVEEEKSKLDKEEKRIKDYCAIAKKYCDIKILTEEITNRFIDFIEVSESLDLTEKKLIIHWNI